MPLVFVPIGRAPPPIHPPRTTSTGPGAGGGPGYPRAGYWTSLVRSFADANGEGIIAPSGVVAGPDRVWAGTPYPTQGAMLTSEWTLGGSFRAALPLDYRAGQRLFHQAAYDRCRLGTCQAAVDRLTPFAEQARAAVLARSEEHTSELQS